MAVQMHWKQRDVLGVLLWPRATWVLPEPCFLISDSGEILIFSKRDGSLSFPRKAADHVILPGKDAQILGGL